MGKIKNILIELTPFLIAVILSGLLGNREILITIIFAITIVVLFLTRYEKIEIYIFVFGLIIGSFIEILGQINFFQWQNFNSILPIPLWLPLSWGYGFVVIRRIGNLIIEKNKSKK